MPNAALQDFLKASPWFSEWAGLRGFRDLDEALQFYAVNAPMWGGLGESGPSPVGSPATVGERAASVPGSVSDAVSGFARDVGEELSTPAGALSAAGGLVGGFPGSGFARGVGAAIGDLAVDQPVDEISMLGLGVVPTGLLNRLFSMVPATAFSPGVLQGVRPDISDPEVQAALEMEPGLVGLEQRSQPTSTPGVNDEPGVAQSVAAAQAMSLDAPSIGPSPQYGGIQSLDKEGGLTAAGRASMSDKEGGMGPSTGGVFGPNVMGSFESPFGGSGGAQGAGPGGVGNSADNASHGGNTGDTGFGYRGGYVTGRKLKHYMQGGPAVGLTGKNPPGPDDGQAYLDEGEFVMPEHAVRYHGLKKMMMMLREAEENEDTDASMMREHQEDKAMGRPMKDVTPGAGMKGMMGMGKGMFRGGPIRRSNLAIPQVPYGARPGGRVTPERNPVRPSVPGTQDMMRPDVHNDPAEMANAGPMNVNQRFVLDPRTGMMFDMLTGQPVATR